MRSASLFNIRRPFNIESISNNNNNSSVSNSNAFSDLQAKLNTEPNGINNELDENRTYELLLTSSSSSNNNNNNNNNNSLDSSNSTSSNNEFSINSKIKKYNDSINQLTSSSFENTSSKAAHDNSKTLLSNPAFNRFFMQQAATSTDNHKKKVCDKSKPTTQMIEMKNFECNNLSSSIVQGGLIKQEEDEQQQQREIKNNKEEDENKKNLETEVSDLKYNLEEQQQQQQQQLLLDELSRVNSNNYNLKQRTNYSNKSNPIVSGNEFTRFFANKTQDKFNHNLIINRNSNNIITNRTDSNNFLRNYDSRRSSCNNNINNFNYYNSATESLGEESDYPSEFESSSIISNNSNTIIKNNHNNINNYDNKKINGYHHYINNTNKNKANRIKQLKQFQLNNNKSLQEIYLQQQQLKKSHNQNINSSKNNNTSNNNSSNKELSVSRAVAEAVILSSNEIEDKEEYLNDKASTNNNTTNSKRISYASITLRQPLKDINYFSDTEGLKSTYNSRNRYKRILTVSRNSNNNSISNSIDNIHNNYNNHKQEQLLNNKTLSSLETISKQQQQQQLNTKTNNSKIEKKSTLNDQAINSFCQFYQPIKSQPTKVTMASSSYLNKQPLQQQTPARVQSYSKLGTQQQLAPTYNAMSTPSYQKWTPPNQPTIQPVGMQQMTSYYNPVPTLAPQPPSQQPQPRYDDYANQYQSYEDDEFYNDNIQYGVERNESPVADPVQERYERELGTELAKPSTSKPNYADSYFYSSSVFNYPTIDEQKKLAKTIACSLEGGDPATSKFHKKKQNNQKSFFRDGYESEAALQTPSEYQSARGADYMYQDESAYDQSYMYDESLPDVIKRSIAKANMTNPIRNVHAPDSFKEQHFTEHVSHTQMPPKVAISLAQELEARQREGGRGAALFQKRKARSEKWIVEDQKKDQFQQFEEQAEPQFIQSRPQPAQPVQQQQQPQPQQPQQPISHYVLPTVQNTNILNSKFSNNYNAKARGWGSSSVASSVYEKAESSYGKEEDFQNESYNTSKAYTQAYAPQQYEMSQASWTPQKSQQQQQQQQQQQIQQTQQSTQMNRFNQQNFSQNEYSQQQQQQLQQSQQSTESKTKFNKLSSHENYLFNNRNAMNVINSNSNNNSNYNTNYNDNDSSTSSSFHIYTGNPTYYHYDESIAASDL